ncbi:MAG: cyclic nucleotide-binding domain-containing protein [Prochlorotrichaceae cyanobacterium]
MYQTLYFLAEMDDRDIDWLLSSGRRRSITKNNALIYQGSPPEALYIIIEGSFAVRIKRDGETIELAQVGAGNLLGEMSFIDSRNASADVIALEDSLVWAIPWTKLSSKLFLDNSFGAHFYHALAVLVSDRMRMLHSQLDANVQLSLEVQREEDLSPQVLKRFELVKARFEYLMQQLKTSSRFMG